jgi:hypothetical protein
MNGKINNGELGYSLLPLDVFHDLCERLLPRVTQVRIEAYHGDLPRHYYQSVTSTHTHGNTYYDWGTRKQCVVKRAIAVILAFVS